MADTHTTQYGEHTPDWVPIAWVTLRNDARQRATAWRCRICGLLSTATEGWVPWDDPRSDPAGDIEAFIRRADEHMRRGRA